MVTFETLTPLTLLGVFGAGVLTAFTPCVLPLVPVIIGVIGSTRGSGWRRRFLLSLVYVLGLALVYAALGVVAALTGGIFGEIQSHPATSLVVGLLFIVFGLAMFGVIRLPTDWLSRAGAGRRVRGEGLLPVFLMGTASGFLAAPCTVPVTFALLTYVAVNQRAFTGFALFLLFAGGMGLPLLVLGTMTAVPAVFGRVRRWTPVVQKVLSAGLAAWGVYLLTQALRKW